MTNPTPSYTVKIIPKRNGRFRRIHIPDETTKKRQKEYVQKIEPYISYRPCVMGYRKGKSILHNARAHINHECLIHYDIVDFFDSITKENLEPALKRLIAHPDIAQDSELRSPNFMDDLFYWCLYEDHLPQGSPASPLLSNLACDPLDHRFSKLAEKIRAAYTRYADDIIISGDKYILQYQTIFKRIIRTEHFHINHNKTKISLLSENAHKVTGLMVGERKVFIDDDYIVNAH